MSPGSRDDARQVFQETASRDRTHFLGQGEMLSGGSPAEGSAGYVTIERVTGALQSRSGSFLLQHSGTMTPTSQESTITVVPGSGTAELEGIAGTMSIEIKNGKHFYDFEYTLSSSR